MSQNISNQTCCTCLNRLNDLIVITDTEKDTKDSISIQEKLKNVLPEIEWLDTLYICTKCIETLNTVYSFRETCLKSAETRKNQTSDVDFEFLSSDSKYEIVIEDNDVTNNLSSNSDSENDEKDTKPVPVKCETERKTNVDEKTNKKPYKRNYVKFECEKCSEEFKSSVKLREHCVVEHKMKRKEIKPFKCQICASKFANSSNLVQHVKYHSAVRSSTCTFCGKGFITKADMVLHEKQHLNKREYACRHCSKGYNTHKDLRSHMLVVHTDPLLWKFFCEICDKRFPIKSNFDCHIRRHTGEKKFKCHICERMFAEKCVLQRHMKTHSNVREFKCSECDKEYKDKRVMQVHMAKIHQINVGKIKLPSSEKKYKCHICSKAYFAKNKLMRHMYTHTGEKPFECTVCPRKFNDMSYVKQHLRRAHNIKCEAGDNV